MSTSAPQQPPKATIGVDQLLNLAVGALDNYFFRNHKEKARKLYKDIAAGNVVDFISLNFKDATREPVKFKLALDYSEYKGHLTFHTFKLALEQMLKNIAGRLRNRQDLNIFSSKETGEMLFHLPGIVQDRDSINVLVMGLVPAKKIATIKLQFLDPEQFKKQTPAEAAEDISPES
jgi:hypothetical protein